MRQPNTSSSLLSALPWLVLASTLIMVSMNMLSEEGLPRYQRLSIEKRKLIQDNARLKAEVKRLQKSIHDIYSHPNAIEDLARRELGMVYPGEIIFQLD